MQSDDGTVGREAAIRVLRENGVAVESEMDGPKEMMVLTKGEIVDARPLPERLGKKLLRYLERKFGVPLHKFYE